jgi:hypothetical protein
MYIYIICAAHQQVKRRPQSRKHGAYPTMMRTELNWEAFRESLNPVEYANIEVLDKTI